ncbi:MAG TPA: hypothetical protein VGO55_18340 [Allosphingosinicella sp.]|jgi:hypothetical protein|nr:hypothetical protein [Allosphingosinicella sp.]
MNVFEFVLGIIVVATLAGLVRAKLGIRRDKWGNEHPIRDDAETARLRDEVKSLKERLAVIERITVEKESSLEREIERLRDR